MKVFISWSKPRSKEIALALRDWLPTVLPEVQPWVSSEDIEKGALWTLALGKELDAARFGIICLVPENLAEAWVIFEAGAIARSIETARVAPLLVGAEIRDVPGPLAQFQCTVFEKADVLKLVHSVNRALDAPVDRRRLDETFDQRWPDLEGRVRGGQRIETPRQPAAAMIYRGEPAEITVEVPAPPPPEQVKILKVLAANPRMDPTAVMMAQFIGENQTRTQYHLDRLQERGLINYNIFIGAPATSYLTNEGRAYVVENNLDRP